MFFFGLFLEDFNQKGRVFIHGAISANFVSWITFLVFVKVLTQK